MKKYEVYVKGSEAVVVLENSAVYWKEALTAKDEEVFWADVPVDPERMVRLMIAGKRGKWLLAADRNDFEPVVAELEKRKVKVVAVIAGVMWPSLTPRELWKRRKSWDRASFIKVKKPWYLQWNWG